MGGAGAYSDGKIILSSEVGGDLLDFVSEAQFERLLEAVDRRFLEFGAPEQVYGADVDALEKIRHDAQKVHLRLLHSPLRHMGTDGGLKVLRNIRGYLREKGVQLRFRESGEEIIEEAGEVRGIRTSKGEYRTRFVIAAPGRAGAPWMAKEMKRLGLKTTPNAVDLGVRVEVPAAVLEPLTDVAYEPKLEYFSRGFDDRVRTFCVNPYGVVIQEHVEGIISVNGHSFSYPASENTNFALLVSTRFTEPFDDPITYGKSIAQLANLLSAGVLVQRLGDLQKGRRSTESRVARNPVKPTLPSAVPGDLSFCLPYRCLADIMEMLEALDRLAPGVASPYTLLYGAEVKFYSNRVRLRRGLQTAIKGLYAVGDGAGVTRGLSQSAVSGLIAARNIIRRVKK
jgi:uncharacterized FAD-dependent dehydrogenase